VRDRGAKVKVRERGPVADRDRVLCKTESGLQLASEITTIKRVIKSVINCYK
jgi:hypothetical protein